MGCFSFLCKESGKPVNSTSFEGDAVTLYLLKGGKVIEEMYGQYDSYGRVFGLTKDLEDTSLTEATSLEWKLPWGDVCDLMFSKGDGDGIAAVLEEHDLGAVPTTMSDSDRNQGWGELSEHKLEGKPYHKTY